MPGWITWPPYPGCKRLTLPARGSRRPAFGSCEPPAGGCKWSANRLSGRGPPLGVQKRGSRESGRGHYLPFVPLNQFQDLIFEARDKLVGGGVPEGRLGHPADLGVVGRLGLL